MQFSAVQFGSHSPTSLPDPSCTLSPVVLRELSTESASLHGGLGHTFAAFACTVYEISPGCAVVLVSTAVGWAGAPAAAFLQQQQ